MFMFMDGASEQAILPAPLPSSILLHPTSSIDVLLCFSHLEGRLPIKSERQVTQPRQSVVTRPLTLAQPLPHLGQGAEASGGEGGAGASGEVARGGGAGGAAVKRVGAAEDAFGCGGSDGCVVA